ncbi:MAG TPA: enoyl-CoA hydratase/isomerase family protein [Acidimicrobiales bacterium]|nr:enoyl-CoA hydratase/isomerase family protein [Acidimicrobiales bacterium]
MTLTWEGPVALVRWDEGENRVNLDSLALLHERLDEVEAEPGPRALVVTGAGKFFSNGLDLPRFMEDPAQMGATLTELHRTVARLFLFPAYTVAALNGHTFAAGALLACGMDYRVMREDRGYWCMNEVDIGMALDEKLAAILFARLPRETVIHAMLTGHRFGASEAHSYGIVEEIGPEDEVVSKALEVAAAMAEKNHGIIAAHKRVAFAEAVAVLGFPVS